MASKPDPSDIVINLAHAMLHIRREDGDVANFVADQLARSRVAVSGGVNQLLPLVLIVTNAPNNSLPGKPIVNSPLLMKWNGCSAIRYLE